MTPSSHKSHPALQLSLALLMAQAGMAQGEQGAAPTMQLELPAICEHKMVLSAGEEAQLATFHAGYQSLLLGHQEAARAYFEQCLAMGLQSPLAHVGLILSNMGMGQNADQLQREQDSRAYLASLQLDTPMTPQEERYLDAFSLLLAGNLAQAAERFASYAEQYRADVALSLWAIQLLHAGYDDEGKPSASQQRAIELADQLLERAPDKALAQIARALVEENAPQVSPTALEAARKAAEMLPTEAMPSLLYAHLLARSGALEAAKNQLIKTEELASAWQKRHQLHWRENSVWVRARLYHITLLQQMGRLNQSQLMLRDTLQRRLPISAKYAKEAPTVAEMLYHWELKTLALRLQIARGEGMSHKKNLELFKEASKGKRSTAYIGYENYLRCLYESLESRLYQREGEALSAQNALKTAQDISEDLAKKWAGAGSYAMQSSTLRAAEACDIALNLVRCEMFATTRELWEEKLRREMRKSSLLMPVIIPVELPE